MYAKRIALTCIKTEGSHEALRWLLSDFAEATLAYSQLAAQTIRGAHMPPPTIISFDWPGTAPAHTTNAQTLQDCDCLVIGCCSQDIFSADKSGAPEMSNSATQQLLSLLEQLPPYAAVYSICSFEGTEPDEALACSTALATIARDCWMGGVTIGGAELTGYLSHQPRMGILRRPISETLDALIAAVRSQTELEGSDRSNLLSARPGIPKPFWRMACNLLVENQRRQ